MQKCLPLCAMNKGVLYLIPSPIGEHEPAEVIPESTLKAVRTLSYFAVEELRTVRRYLSKCGLKGKIEELHLFELNEHTLPETVQSYLSILTSGNDMGLISEAGLPAVADPGAYLVELAQSNGIKVVPMVGASSLMMALMASGLNGQCFAFTGYLPIKQQERRSKIREIEHLSIQFNQSQIIIETPYRNDQLFADMLAVCSSSTRICIAADISMPQQFILTKTVSGWKSNLPLIGKRPCVFILLGRTSGK